MKLSDFLFYEEPGVQLYCGDSFEILPLLYAESCTSVCLESCDGRCQQADAIVTDPPYGLEFMGKEWDRLDVRQPNDPTFHRSGVGPYDRAKVRHSSAPSYGGSVGGAMQAWHEQWTRAVLRILKPGAHLLAFGGTRTHHRLMCALEDAGFEIRDTLMWLYGCLSDDTDVLIDGQWVPYHEATPGRLALCYDTQNDAFSWQPIRSTVRYDYDDLAFRICSDRTDQLVSRNHRCLVERDGAWQFALAEEVARQRQASVPILEDLPCLLASFPLPNQGAGCPQHDVLADVLIGSAQQPASAPPALTEKDEGDRVRGLSQKSMEAVGVAEARQGSDVLAALQRRAPRCGMEAARPQRSQSVDGSISSELSAQDERLQEPGMEGRGNVLQEARQLRRCPVRSMPAFIHGDGAQGRLRNGASTPRGEGAWPLSDQDRDGTSRGRQPLRQPSLNAIRDESGPQTVRGAWHTTADLARVIPMHYRGIVWCLNVPTGAFVARRNGKVFVTGNSGFPKSLDVSKAIDKAAGAQRTEVVGHRHRNVKPFDDNSGWNRNKTTGDFAYKAPATDSAREWAGWGTALKPAWEPIILARKPLSEPNVAANVLRWGTGALNVDGGRIETDEHLRGGAGGLWSHYRDGKEPSASNPASPRGRWPANLLLDEQSAAMLDAQSGTLTSGDDAVRRKVGSFLEHGGLGKPGDVQTTYGDSGGASRFFYISKADRADRDGSKHPTIKPRDLCGYLVRLVTPPGGLVVDPFMGSGPIVWAAREYGFRVIGIERDRASCQDAVHRLRQKVLAL